MLAEVEKIFNKLQRIGVKEIVLFSKEGVVIKSTLDDETTRMFVEVASNMIKGSVRMFNGLIGSEREPSVLKAVTDDSELNVIVSKQHVLVYRIRAVNTRDSKFLEIAEKIDSIFR